MDDKVTTRRKNRTIRSNSENDVTEIFDENCDVLNSTIMMDTTMRSIQSDTLHSYIQNDTYTEELKGELQVLRDKIIIADNEIESLNIEVNELKLSLKDKEIQIDLLKKLATNFPTTQNKSDTPIKKKIVNIGIKMSRVSPIQCLRKSYLNLNLTPLRCNQELQTKMNGSPALHLRRNSISENLSGQQMHTISNSNVPYVTIPKETKIKDNCKMSNSESSRKIIILADQQGRGLREKLQNLIGDDFKVFCYTKPGATLAEVLHSVKPESLNLSDRDIVIILGGINDKNPELFQIRLNMWLEAVRQTKVIIGEVPYNYFLNVDRLNYLLRFISGRHDNVIYTKWNYESHLTKLNYARLFLKEILHIDYVYKFNQYTLAIDKLKQKKFVNSYTQTDILELNSNGSEKIINLEPNIDKSNNSNFFRV